MWLEEIMFLEDQRGPRLYALGGIDGSWKKMQMKRIDKERRKEDRNLQLKERRERDKEMRRTTDETVLLDDSSASISSSAGGSPVKRKRGRIDRITPEVVEVIDSGGISSTLATKIICAVSKACGKNVDESNVNLRSVQRKREKHRAASATDVQTSFSNIADPILTVHWDGKIVPSLDGSQENVDRQAIIVTGVTTEQFLGAPSIPNGTALNIASAVVSTLKEWKVEENVKSMSFDTTSVNTGTKNGAALRIERALGKKLIWLPCRHHVFERMIEDVFKSVMGPSTSPEVAMFRDFQKRWETIDRGKYDTFSKWTASRSALASHRETIILFAEENLSKGQPRNDYMELLELSIIFLEGSPPKGVRFRKPGAVHSARWMAKAIYCLKISMFRQQSGLSRTEADRILHVAIFIVIIYIKAWFTAPYSISAPRNDLELLKSLLKYECVNKTIAKAAQTRFSYHLWYLSEELLGLAVFDEDLDSAERERLVWGMQNREGEDDPPKKRQIQLKDVPTLSISALATKGTKAFFEVLGIPMEFLAVPTNSWKNRVDYLNAKEIVKSLQVINDHAERGVKLMTDFNKTVTKKETSFQQLLINVRTHRKSLPNLQKTSLVAKYQV